MRLLGVTRLSRKTDESTSIERQREQITLTARVRGDDPVHITEDTDVSGAISPFLREQLGPWLTEPEKIAQYDGIIVAKVDRLTRSLSDFDELVAWCDRHGKTLVSVSESLDLSTSTGRMFANLLAMFAQFERERMSERRREAAVKIRENGWWAGFGVPYGRRPVKVNDHWELEVDPENLKRLEMIGREILKGHSVTSVAKSLTEAGTPTPGGGKEWRQNTIRDMFTNPGCPLDPDLLAQVLEALDTTKTPWTKRGDAAMLLNVAYCECGAALYSKRYTSKGHLYEYYDCSAHCGRRRIPMADLERVVGEGVEYLTGPVWRKVAVRGKSNAAEISAIERKIRALDLDANDYAERHAELMAERKRLRESTGQHPDSVTYEDTGLTIENYWPTLDRHQKRQFLLQSKIRVNGARRTPAGGVIIGSIDSPEEFYVMVT